MLCVMCSSPMQPVERTPALCVHSKYVYHTGVASTARYASMPHSNTVRCCARRRTLALLSQRMHSTMPTCHPPFIVTGTDAGKPVWGIFYPEGVDEQAHTQYDIHRVSRLPRPHGSFTGVHIHPLHPPACTLEVMVQIPLQWDSSMPLGCTQPLNTTP